MGPGQGILETMNRALIEQAFPGLRGKPFEITSPQALNYNCIAWSAQDSTRWWWPAPGYFWPEGSPRETTIKAFRNAFGTLGFAESASPELEEGFEKAAIFIDADGIPSHAARQLPNGRWTSKLGPQEDIEHSLVDLEGNRYGRVAVVMRRPRASID